MANHKRIEHVELVVEDLEAAASFGTDVLGLAEVARRDGVVYLGCGLDANYDLALRAGPTELGHVAFRVAGDRLEAVTDRLADRGVATGRRDGTEPGQARGLRFALPSGLPVELVTVEDAAVHNYDKPRLPRQGTTPVDLDHITLGVPDVRADAEFLVDALGFRATTVKTDTGTPEGTWHGAFLRDGAGYHDVALLERPSAFVQHVAWEMTGIDQMKAAIDRLAGAGHRLETSIHRHDGGGNLAAYFFEPGGPHLYELCSEEATVAPETPTRYTTPEETGFSAWGGVEPPRHPAATGE